MFLSALTQFYAVPLTPRHMATAAVLLDTRVPTTLTPCQQLAVIQITFECDEPRKSWDYAREAGLVDVFAFFEAGFGRGKDIAFAIPDDLKERTLYISITHCTAVHKCCWVLRQLLTGDAQAAV